MLQSSNKELVSWLGEVSSGRSYALREFPEDTHHLDIEFSSNNQPHLVTEVLTHTLLCDGLQVREEEIWTWSLKKRLQALLSLTIAKCGNRMTLTTTCQNDSCAERVELPLELEVFKQDVINEEFDFNVDKNAITARLPNGLDQLEWLENKNLTPVEIAKSLLLTVNGDTADSMVDIEEKWLVELGEELEKQDSLMTLQIKSACPVCEQELSFDVDLESKLLEALSYKQRKTFIDIHQLALAYHWNENDILALSPKRRDFYLARLHESQMEEVQQ